MTKRPLVMQEHVNQDLPDKELYMVTMATGHLMQSPTHDAIIQALLYFKEKYPKVTVGYYTKHRNYNPSVSHDWIVENFRHRCKYLLMGSDWDQTCPEDMIVKQFDYMEAHPTTFLCGIKINRRDGYPLSFNRGSNPRQIPMWLPPDAEGIIHPDYMAFNFGMFKTKGFNLMKPPFFLELISRLANDQPIFRVDGIRAMNRKASAVGLKRVILDVKCGHTTLIKNPALENMRYFSTVCQGKFLK